MPTYELESITSMEKLSIAWTSDSHKNVPWVTGFDAQVILKMAVMLGEGERVEHEYIKLKE